MCFRNVSYQVKKKKYQYLFAMLPLQSQSEIRINSNSILSRNHLVNPNYILKMYPECFCQLITRKLWSKLLALFPSILATRYTCSILAPRVTKHCERENRCQAAGDIHGPCMQWHWPGQ